MVDHAFSTRLGGCSTGTQASLNTAFHTGDSEENVIENRRRLLSLFNYDHQEIVSSIQVHGTELALFDQADRGEGAMPGSAQRKCDALITTTVGLPLTAYSADCILIYVASREKPLVALVHAGWRGTLGGIGTKVVRYLHEQFGAAPNQLLIALSPAICRDCYMVDDQVALQFRSAGWGDSTFLEPAAADNWSLDLGAINSKQLLLAGVTKEHLVHSNWCTSCNPDLFYSYRRDKGDTGRMFGFIAVRKHSGGSAV